MVEIIPAVNPVSIEEIENKISLVKNSVGEVVQKIQLDFVDGKYAPPITWPFNLNELPKVDFQLPFFNDLILEADLLIKHPEDWISDFVRIGIRSFIIHLDSTHYLDRCIHDIKKAGLLIGIGIKPSGDIFSLEKIMNEKEIDFVQFMGNDKVGYNGVGVPLDRKVLRVILDFRVKFPFVPIQVDIGVNMETAQDLVKVGATGLVSGSAVFKDGKIEENIQKLYDLTQV